MTNIDSREAVATTTLIPMKVIQVVPHWFLVRQSQ